MKMLKALLVALTLSCLLATAAPAGTMTTGAGQPPPPSVTPEDDVDAFFEAPAEDAPAAAEVVQSFDVVREAMLRIAFWISW